MMLAGGWDQFEVKLSASGWKGPSHARLSDVALQRGMPRQAGVVAISGPVILARRGLCFQDESDQRACNNECDQFRLCSNCPIDHFSPMSFARSFSMADAHRS